LSCAPMTQDSGSFDEVEAYLATLARTIDAAWAVGGKAAEGHPST
jgi:hypothetical protein